MSWIMDLISRMNNPPNPRGTDKITTHSYGHVYEQYFTSRRESARHVLELGVYEGAFTQVLAQIFPKAEIHGVDIKAHPAYGQHVPYHKIIYHQMDVTDPATPTAIGLHFDVIIDDASNLKNDQISSFHIFSPFLNRGGIYVIEDIHSADLESIRPTLETIARREGLDMTIHDLRAVKHRENDIIAVFEKR